MPNCLWTGVPLWGRGRLVVWMWPGLCLRWLQYPWFPWWVFIFLTKTLTQPVPTASAALWPCPSHGFHPLSPGTNYNLTNSIFAECNHHSHVGGSYILIKQCFAFSWTGDRCLVALWHIAVLLISTCCSIALLARGFTHCWLSLRLDMHG